MTSKDWVSAEKQDKNSDQIEELEKVPPLRFPEFSGNWNGIKLKRIFTNKTSNLSINNLLENKGEYKLYGATGLIKCIDFYEINVPYVAIVKDGAGVGRITLCDENSSILGTMQALIAKEDFDLKFSYYSLNKINFNKYVIGSTIPHIYFKDYSKETVFVPSINEQKKISAFITLVDKKIELMERKQDILVKYKWGLLQKIFSEKSNLYTSKIGEIFEERSEKGFSDLELLSVTLKNGVIKRSDIESKDNSNINKDNYKHVLPGDIVYNSMRMWQGASGVSEFEGIVSPAYTILKSNNKENSHYFAYYFKTHKMINQFKKYSQGLTSDTWNLKYPLISEISIKIHPLKEQNKIADFLSKIDNKIDSVEQQLEKIKEFKKYLLQQMFV